MRTNKKGQSKTTKKCLENKENKCPNTDVPINNSNENSDNIQNNYFIRENLNQRTDFKETEESQKATNLLKKKKSRTVSEEDTKIDSLCRKQFTNTINLDMPEINIGNKILFDINFNHAFNSRNRYEYTTNLQQSKIILKIKKSNTNLSFINKTYIITEEGVKCSQKTGNRHYTSIGRQQVNDDGQRPNDIMLFPTDPSISRSHCKIFHESYFQETKAFNEKLIYMVAFSVKKKCKLDINNVLNIAKYFNPGKSISVEDNGTIYGTYVKVKSFSINEILSNLYLFLKDGKDPKYYTNNFNLDSIISILVKDINKFVIERKSLQNCKSINNLLYMHYNKDKFLDCYLRNYANNIAKAARLAKFICLNENLTEKNILESNNQILKKGHVYLTAPKLGFVIAGIGSASDIKNAVKEEYSTFCENFNHYIEINSHEKVFEDQRLDPNSKIFKLTMPKEQFLILNIVDLESKYSFLYLIKTNGDPCGVMNRVYDSIYLMDRNFTNPKKSFTFNYLSGYLFGMNTKSCLHLNTESDYFIYYESKNDKWMITDLTKFLNPEIFSSKDYHGIWRCLCSDKKLSSRFNSERVQIQSNDELKISETVMSLEIYESN